MKTRNKALLLALCALSLVAASVFGTLAYLTDTEAVTNTFTVGKVDITLNEAPVDATGKETTGDRVQANVYHLLPNHVYDKDPTVHFQAGSDASWLFVKVENGLVGIESKVENYSSIAEQIVAKGWTKLDSFTDTTEDTVDTAVYYKSVPANTGTAAQDHVVFESFTIDSGVTGDTLDTYQNATIVVTAYAIQADGFSDAATAWNTVASAAKKYPAAAPQG